MQKCDLQVNKLVREKYGPYKLNSVKNWCIVVKAWVNHVGWDIKGTIKKSEVNKSWEHIKVT